MTVAELCSRVGPPEFSGWMAFYEMQNGGDEQAPASDHEWKAQEMAREAIRARKGGR